jgi:Rad3-related DNA helicase
VLVAPSMDRGVDLPGELCRVQVVMKLPHPYLGDAQVNARLRETEGGELWYQLETIRTLVQMTGRGVRSAEDWATTYVLDKQLVFKWDDWVRWLPEWWADAVVMDRRPSDVLPGIRGI